MERLIVKNFGPIKEIDIELKKTMVFIGTQSTGKSVLAKLISIFKSHYLYTNEASLSQFFEYYQIYSFFQDNSFIEFNNEIFKIKITNLNYELTFNNQKFSSDLLQFKGLKNNSDFITSKILIDKWFSNLLYIPAERSFTSYAIGSLAGLISNNILIPKTILNFVSEFEKARTLLKSSNLDIFDIKYEHKNGDDVVVLSNKTEIFLKNCSSGYQSVIPLCMVIENKYKIEKQATTFVVEEPELNLFPEIQQKMIYYLVEKCCNKNVENNLSNELIITTHSPYTLTSLNNLLLAFQTASKSGLNDEVIKVIPQKSWINPEDFEAYSLADGFATSIFNKETLLIEESVLDAASETIMQDFYDLMELYKK